MKDKKELTDLQKVALKAIGRKTVSAAQAADLMDMPGQAIKVSGVLSSLLERGLLRSSKAPKGRGVVYTKKAP